MTATGNSNRRISGDEVEDDVEDVIEEDDGRPRLKVLFQPTVGKPYASLFPSSNFLTKHRHNPYHLLQGSLASYQKVQED